MYHIKLKELGRDQLTENGQTALMLYALIDGEDDKFTNTMPLVKCRDYFNDVAYIQSTKGNTLDMIYGFKWKYRAKFNQQQQLLMYINTSNPDMNLDALHEFEDDLGFARTTVTYDVDVTGDTDNLFNNHAVLCFSSSWFANSFMASFFTQMLRFAWYKDMEETKGGTDGCFLDIIRHPKILIILHNWRDILGKGSTFDQDAYESHNDTCDGLVYCIHNGGGIKSMFNALTGLGCEPAIEQWRANYNEFVLLNKKEAA